MLKQETAELERNWQARAAVASEGERQRRAQEARAYLERAKKASDDLALQWREMAQEVGESHAPVGSQVKEWPESQWFEELDQGLDQAKTDFALQIAAVVGTYRKRIDELTILHARWAEVQTALARADADFLAACLAHGLQPEDVTRLQEIAQRLKAKRSEVEQADAQLAAFDKQLATLPERSQRLASLWRQEFECREAAMARLLTGKQMPRVGVEQKPFVKVALQYMGEKRHFDEVWTRLIPDRRSALGRAWDEIGNQLRDAFRSQSTADVTPWTLLGDWLQNPPLMPADVQKLSTQLQAHLTVEKAMLFDEVRLTRIRDSVDLTLYRKDGDEAGSLQSGGLSDGQRNTAVLALLLSEGAGPVIIDQPEEELDSDFLYHELVPMLRELKERRQLIIVTHNANLPVNGDAELVCALRAVGGHGAKLAEGGIDRLEVRDAVLDIMEGSEEAFRRRREKYHF